MDRHRRCARRGPVPAPPIVLNPARDLLEMLISKAFVNQDSTRLINHKYTIAAQHCRQSVEIGLRKVA